MDIINKVWRGDAGLARTYWLFGVLAGLFFWLAIGAVTPGSIEAVVVSAALGAFLFWVNTGIWRAASKYEGPSIWSGLAHAAAALGFILAIGATFGSAYAVATRSWAEPPTKNQDFDPDFWKKGGTPVN